jgi:hypothetical protein
VKIVLNAIVVDAMVDRLVCVRRECRHEKLISLVNLRSKKDVWWRHHAIPRHNFLGLEDNGRINPFWEIHALKVRQKN